MPNENGAEIRQPVSKVIEGYSYLEAQSMFSKFSYETALVGGDVSLFASTRWASFFHTAFVPQRRAFVPLARDYNPAIGQIVAETSIGRLSLDEFVTSPKSFIQAIIVAHQGKVVYERYPGMKPSDSHLWASAAKPITGLLVDILIDEGKVDQNKTYGYYVTDFRGTVWENIKIIDLLNMASGLNIEENDVTRHEPLSVCARIYQSEFGNLDPVTQKSEATRSLLKLASKEIDPGLRFDYSSFVTQSLVILIEEVSKKRFSDFADEKVFSHMMLDAPMQFHLSGTDRLELAHGVVSGSLHNLLSFGLLYTPSWNKISDKQVVSDAALRRIRKELPSHEFYMAGYDGPRFTAALNDYVVANSRQWDNVFPDGDMFKLGFMGQGIYVSPDRDLVIAYFSTNPDEAPGQGYMRPIAKSEYFNK
jgi:CubicO group peptidase (beta-lactamase class C family)